MLNQIHSIPTLRIAQDWHLNFIEEKYKQLREVLNYDIYINGGDTILQYFIENKHLIYNRPICFNHGDYHLGNLLAIANGDLIVLDWENNRYGDLWNDFMEIYNANIFPYFITGLIHGYFNGEPSPEFWKLFSLYVSSSVVACVFWAANNSPDLMKQCVKNVEKALQSFNYMKSPVPDWYIFCQSCNKEQRKLVYYVINKREEIKMTDKEEYVFETILARRSVRSFVDDKQVEKKKIIKLLEAAMAAPSACNLQPWEFVVVSKKDMLEQLINETWQGKYNAPLAMIICANVSNIPWDGNGWMIDCSAAVENMMITAVAMGLGSIWIGAYNEDKIRKLFNIPDHIMIMNIVYFGYPNETKAVGTKYTEDAVYWDTYNPSRKRVMRTIDMKSDIFVNPPTPWEID